MSEQDAEGAHLADELAAEFGRAEDQRTSSGSAAPEQPRGPSRVPWIIAAVSVAVILVQIPTLRASLAEKPSLHSGVEITDPITEACMRNLWTISALVQEGESAEAIARLPLVEPISREPYSFSVDDDELVVACPNPSAHGLKRLRVTESDPMPEALR